MINLSVVGFGFVNFSFFYFSGKSQNWLKLVLDQVELILKLMELTVCISKELLFPLILLLFQFLRAIEISYL